MHKQQISTTWNSKVYSDQIEKLFHFHGHLGGRIKDDWGRTLILGLTVPTFELFLQKKGKNKKDHCCFWTTRYPTLGLIF